MALMVWGAVSAQEVVTIEIQKGREAPIAIAILPFGGDPDPAEIIAQDLRRTGRFDPILAKRRLDPELWRQLGTDYLVEGELRREGEALLVAFRLDDLYVKRQLAASQLRTPEGSLREATHRISDQIYEALLHRPGPFGQKIAFVEREGELWRLMVADYDGQNGRPILISPEPVLEPTFSPDGRFLAYTSLEGWRPALYLQELASGERRLIAEGAHAPAFSPDGKELAFTRLTPQGIDLHLLDLATGSERSLTKDAFLDTEPRFSQDGRALFFVSDRGGLPQLYRLDLERLAVRPITSGEAAHTAPLPLGELLVALRSGEAGDRLVLLDPQSGREHPLTSGPRDDAPTAAPSSDLLLYTLEVGNRDQLGLAAVNGRWQEVLPSPLPRAMPAWRPRTGGSPVPAAPPPSAPSLPAALWREASPADAPEPKAIPFQGAVLGEEALALLRRHAAYLRSHPELGVMVVGESRGQGSRSYHFALSYLRARAVADLLRLYDIGRDRILLLPRGEEGEGDRVALVYLKRR